jgi:hypothetical protein
MFTLTGRGQSGETRDGERDALHARLARSRHPLATQATNVSH